jgi:uncharacterized iron-regulated membrane protein
VQLFRKVIFWAHLICGVVGGLVVFIMSITGVALTYEKQMLKWAESVEIEAPAGQEHLGPEALLERVRLETGKAPSGITFSSSADDPARVLFGRESVAVNPYTGQVVEEGDSKLGAFFDAMILWHRWLGQEGEGRAVGKAITGACNLAFLFIVVSGAYLWWPKKWSWQHLRPIVWFRGGLSPKARDFNWHNTMGFWCAVPLFFVVATAVFFSYPWANETLYALTGEPQQTQRSGGPPQGGAPPGRGGGHDGGQEHESAYQGLDAAWATAQTAAPGWKTLSFRPAEKPGEPISVAVDRGMGGQPQLRSTLTVDGRTGEVLKHETIADLTTGRRIRSYIRFIHTGEVFGFVGQTIAGVVSLAACFLVYTGWTLTWRRFRAWQERRG